MGRFILGILIVIIFTSGCASAGNKIIGAQVYENVLRDQYKKTHQRCPFCKGWMERGPTVCPHCGKSFN